MVKENKCTTLCETQYSGKLGKWVSHINYNTLPPEQRTIGFVTRMYGFNKWVFKVLETYLWMNNMIFPVYNFCYIHKFKISRIIRIVALYVLTIFQILIEIFNWIEGRLVKRFWIWKHKKVVVDLISITILHICVFGFVEAEISSNKDQNIFFIWSWTAEKRY